MTNWKSLDDMWAGLRGVIETMDGGVRVVDEGKLRGAAVDALAWHAALSGNEGVRDTARWAMRLGVRNPYGLQTAHGLHTMTHNEHTLKDHPDWFALQPDGTRDNSRADGGHRARLCVSNRALIEQVARDRIAEARKYPRWDTVSVSPNDGGRATFCNGGELSLRMGNSWGRLA